MKNTDAGKTGKLAIVTSSGLRTLYYHFLLAGNLVEFPGLFFSGFARSFQYHSETLYGNCIESNWSRAFYLFSVA